MLQIQRIDNKMIPKKKRRTIMVNGTVYEYCLSGFVNFYIKNLTTGKRATDFQDVEPKWKVQITPKNVRDWILKHNPEDYIWF